MSLFGGSSSGSPSPQDLKVAVAKQLQQEAAMANARALISKVNEHCFATCIPKPGDSLSSSEQTCLSSCMEKYISLWNTTSKAYISRVGVESKRLGHDASVFNSMATGSD